MQTYSTPTESQYYMSWMRLLITDLLHGCFQWKWTTSGWASSAVGLTCTLAHSTSSFTMRAKTLLHALFKRNRNCSTFKPRSSPSRLLHQCLLLSIIFNPFVERTILLYAEHRIHRMLMYFKWLWKVWTILLGHMNWSVVPIKKFIDRTF